MRTISISSQKGGTGKTTTAAAIAQGAVELGYKPLWIDLDAQDLPRFGVDLFLCAKPSESVVF